MSREIAAHKNSQRERGRPTKWRMHLSTVNWFGPGIGCLLSLPVIFGRTLRFFMVVAVVLQVMNSPTPTVAAQPPCSGAWYLMIEEKLQTGDGQGHGPDVGSDEWQSVVEFKLGIRDQPGIPKRGSGKWCSYIDKIVHGQVVASPAGNRPEAGVAAQGPSFACDKAEPGSTEAMICDDKELAALDQKLAEVYAAALKKAGNERPPLLRAEQRGWIKGRNECWKSNDESACVRDAYILRIAELQARYRLVPAEGPVFYVCDGNPANEVVATFFRTEPKTLIAERGDSVSLMYIQVSGSGARYQGRNEMFWEHQGEATITWGYDAQEMRCKRKE